MKKKKGFLYFYIFLMALFVTAPLYGLELSKEEKDYLKRIKTIKVGVVGDMPPLEYYGAGYKHQGVVSDFLHEVAKKLDITLEYKVGTSDGLLEMVMAGEVDMLSFFSKSKKSEDLLLFTDPFLELENSLYVKKDSATINHLKDLQNGLLTVQYNSPIKEALKEKFPDMGLRYANSHQEAFELMLLEEVEAFVGSSIIGNYLINKYHYADHIKKTDIPWLKTPLSFAVSQKKPILKELIQKAVADIDYKTHNQIVQKWLIDAQKYKKMPISFTDEENAWIKANPIVTIGASTEWKPLSYFEKGKIQGVTSSYLEVISEKTGIKFKAQKVGSFAKMLEAIKDKKLDMLDAVVPSTKRADDMDFSNSYLRLDNIIAIRNDQPKIKAVNGLGGKRVGIVAGYIVGQYLANDVPSAKIIEYEDIEKGLRAISSGDLDAFLLDLPMFDYYSAKFKISNLVVSANTPYSFPVHFAIKKDQKILTSIINKALDSIDENQRNKIYRKWISVKFIPKIDYELVWKIVAVFLLFLGGAFYWNRKLTKEIAKRKEVEKELVVAKETAEDATKAKSAFLANMSHEIRTPMNSVIGFADLLDDLIKEPVQRGYLRSIQIGGKALLGIINDILDLSKIEAGQLKIVNESINVHNLFLEMQQFFHDKINQKNLTFDIKIEPDIPKYLILDGVRLRQILLNLISNAIKFTEKGGIVLRVGREFKDSEKSKMDLFFEVEDTGIGVPKEDLETIFEDFVQREKQSVQKYGGTGLGLSICKRLVEIMNGSISVESQVGVGATFKVFIRDVGVSSLGKETQEEEFMAVEFEKATLLIVDDIEENRELVRAVFANTPLLVKEAKNGQEALGVVSSEKVDMIFMDLQMPILDGYGATVKIRKSFTKEQLPIVALTASVMGEELEKVEEFGFNGYLRKPTSKKVLIQEASKFLPCKKDKGAKKNEYESVLFESQEVKTKISNALNKELLKEWEEMKDKGDVTLVEAFNDKLIKLLKIQELKILKEYSDKMSVCIESFDLVEMYNLLSAYPALVEKISKGEVK